MTDSKEFIVTEIKIKLKKHLGLSKVEINGVNIPCTDISIRQGSNNFILQVQLIACADSVDIEETDLPVEIRKWFAEKKEKKILICQEKSHVFDKKIMERYEYFACNCGKQTGHRTYVGGLVNLPEGGRIE